MAEKRHWLIRFGALGAAAFMATCSTGSGGPGEKLGQGAAKVTTENLLLQDLTSVCSANKVQDLFSVTNNDTAPIALSDITIKMWVDETTASAILASTSNGCVSNAGAGGACDHSVGATKVTVSAMPQACGGENANWEVDVFTHDHSPLNPGQTWTGFGVAISLAKNKAFTPGASGWYSTCGGSTYAPTANVAVYYQGSLVHASAGIPPTCVAPTGSQAVGGATAPAIAAGQVPLVGPLPADTPLMLGVSLPLQNELDAQTLLSQLYDPTSDQYGHFISPAEFGDMFGATPTDYQAVVDYFTNAGLTVAATYSNRLHLTLTGTAAAIENALNVTLNQYKRPDGSIFYAPANDPSLNLTVPIAFIAGLDSYAQPTPQDGSGSSYASCPVGNGVSGSGAGYMGQDFRKIYLNNPTALLGDNLTAAVVAFDAFDPSVTNGGPCTTAADCPASPAVPWQCVANVCQFTSDPDLYAQAAGQGPLHVQQIPCNLNPAVTPASGEGEVSADVSLIYAMAPHAQINVYEFPSTSGHPAANTYDGSATGFLAIMHRILEDHTANVIVNSWTWQSGTAAPDPTVANVFLQAALEGMSFFQASGDVGAYTNSGFCAVSLGACTTNANCNFATDPADTCNFGGAPEPIINSPLMTVVGATLLPGAGQGTSCIEGQNGTCTSPSQCCSNACDTTSGKCITGDFAWDAGAHVAGQFRSTGGGPVQGYTGVLGTMYQDLPSPPYQASVLASVNAAQGTSFTQRLVPDVSIVGDQITTYYRDGSTQSCAGGTSYSAALWGGVGLLIHQANHNLGQPALGMANYALYNQAASASGAASFYDVPGGEGSNPDYSGFNFSTANGYDMVTGLGTPKPGLVGANSVLPPQSCQSGSNLTLLVNKATGDVTAYTPNGAWALGTPGIRWVPIESASGTLASATDIGAAGGLPAIGVVNTCSADSSGSGNVVCTGNDPSIWLIQGQTALGHIDNSAQATTNQNFSGGSCQNCNVAVDPLSHQAYVSIGTATGAALQAIDLPAAFSSLSSSPLAPSGVNLTPIALNQPTSSEAIAVDATRGAVLSANEQSVFQFVNATNGSVYNFNLSSLPGLNTSTPWEFDATAEDCSTGVAVATVEIEGPGKQIVLVDLKQAAFDNASATWATGQCNGTSAIAGAQCAADAQCANHCNAQGQCILSNSACTIDADCPVVSTCANPFTGVGTQTFPEMTSFSGWLAGVAMASDGSHLGIASTEFGGNQFVVFQLKADGSPAVADYAVADVPNLPDGSAFQMGWDPHTLGIYTSPNDTSANPKVFGVMQNNYSTSSHYLAVIDVRNMLNTTLNPRTAGTNQIASPLSSCCTVPMGTCLAPSAVPNCVVKFIPN